MKINSSRYREGGGKKGKGAPPPPPPPAKSRFEAEAFDSAHPDGRYALNLDRPVEYTVASQLFQLEDTTPGQNIVNVRYCGKPVTEDPVASGWPEKMPARGLLEFDFVTRGGAPPGAEAIDAEDLEEIRAQVGHPMGTPLERLNVVRFVCASHYFTCKQGAALLTEMDHGRDRVEAAAALFPRVIFANDADGAAKTTTQSSRRSSSSSSSSSSSASPLNELLAPLATSEQEEFFKRIGGAGASLCPRLTHEIERRTVSNKLRKS